MTTTWEKPRLLQEIEARLDEHGDFEGSLANSVVAVKTIESQYDAFQLALRCAKVPNSPRWTISSELLPAEAKKIMQENSRSGKLSGSYTAMLSFPAHGGQTGGGGRNFSIVVLPYWGEPAGKVLEIEIGCKHDMSVTNLGRCYNKYTCTKCEFSYSVDSSD